MARNIKTCPVCKGTFPDPPSGKKRFCSPKCRMVANPYKKHGESGTRLHNIWCGMKSRCSKTASSEIAKKYYVNRGITVCEDWKTSYETFRDWALANGYASNLELDRIDNEKGYSPENCRWVSRCQQMRNTRIGRNHPNKTSKYRGVQLMKELKAKPWRAMITLNGKPKHLGCFEKEFEAAKAFDDAAFAEFGDKASLNFPQRKECASF